MMLISQYPLNLINLLFEWNVFIVQQLSLINLSVVSIFCRDYLPFWKIGDIDRMKHLQFIRSLNKFLHLQGMLIRANVYNCQ